MNIYNYLDYRNFLRDLYAELKESKSHFSFRYFARVAGFSSSGYLKMVIDGERNLSSTSINQFSKGFKFSKRESAYFESLVLFNQAKTPEERDLYLERLSAMKPKDNLKGLEKEALEYFTQKHYVIIREMVALPTFQEDPEWIAARLSPPIKPKDAKEAIAALLRLGLLTRNEAGKLVQADASLVTAPEVDSLEVFNFHRTMLNDAKEAMAHVPPSLRDITSLTIPIPIHLLPGIKGKIQALREEIIHMMNQGVLDYDEVFQLNIQLFPVTKVG